MHISAIIKTIGNSAKLLSQIQMDDDEYHRNIQNTAAQLTETGQGDYQYITQYASGACSWRPPTTHLVVEPTNNE